MKENRCIVCGEQKNGLEVKEDYIIGSIRWIKRNITMGFWPEKGSRLVVCKGCYPKYSKYRTAYVRKSIMYPTLGVLFLIALLFVSPNKVLAIIYGLILIIVMYALSLLTYTPAVKTPEQ